MGIKIVDYKKQIGNTTVLDGINIAMEEGKVYGLKGKNGAGKTMLMRAISGLIRPTTGYVEVDGQKIGTDISFPESMGMLLENPGFIPEYSGMENLWVLAKIRNKITKNEIADMMKKVGLDPDEKKKYKKYSLGMKQKLGIAAALMENPKLIILDEPVNALDEDSILKFENMLKELKTKKNIIVISCHDSEELYQFSDEIFFMEAGCIKEHKVLEKKEDEKM